MADYTSPPTPDPPAQIRRLSPGYEVEDDGSPGVFYKADGTLWLRDPLGAESEIGADNGGSQPVTTPGGVYDSGDTVTLPSDQSAAPMHWGYDYGTELLDLTDPFSPTIIDAGIYFVAANVRATSSFPDKAIAVSLAMDPDDTYGYIYTDVDLKAADASNSNGGCSMAWYMAAGAKVQVLVTHADGDPGITVVLSATVQRLS